MDVCRAQFFPFVAWSPDRDALGSIYEALSLSWKFVCLKAWKLRNSFLCSEFKAFIRAVRDESMGVVITLNKLLSVGLAQRCLSDPRISSIIHLKRHLQYASAQFKAYILGRFKISSELRICFNSEAYWFPRIKECQTIDKLVTNSSCLGTPEGKKTHTHTNTMACKYFIQPPKARQHNPGNVWKVCQRQCQRQEAFRFVVLMRQETRFE